MPKMGESITEGTVIAWHKQPGEAVEVDETLLEIGTDKVDTEVPSPAAGVLAEILVPEGETVEVGTVIARIETEAEATEDAAPDEAPPAEADTAEADTATTAQAEAPVEEPVAEETLADTAAPPQAEAPAGGGRVEVVMPKMGESITEGTVIAWHKQPGEAVEVDETLLEIGTDKVDTEVPSPAAGVLAEILVPEGETVEVGTPLAVIATEAGAEGASAGEGGAPAASPDEPAGDGAGRPAAPAAEQTAAPSGGDGAVMAPAGDTGEVPRTDESGRFYSPLVRAIAREEGLSLEELASIEGSGREGRVTKEDVLAYLQNRKQRSAPAAPAAAPEPPRTPAPAGRSTAYEGRVEIIEMDRMRQIIAEHMVHSKRTSAHVTSFAEADVTNLVRFRERNKQAFLEREGIKLTYTPFFVHAAVEALRDHPLLNASVEGKRILVKKEYHIGMAVALGKTGLIAPVIRDAGQKNIVGLAHAAADLAERARNKQLQPDELQSGTFTVTNIGSLGSLMGTPIINQPQVAILATGAIKKRPVVVEDPALGDVIAIRHMMYVSLSYDHRIIDGAMGASFLQRFVEVLETIDPDGTL